MAVVGEIFRRLAAAVKGKKGAFVGLLWTRRERRTKGLESFLSRERKREQVEGGSH